MDMAVNATDIEYDASAGAWSRARDVVAGEDAVKRAGEGYLPRLDAQTDDGYRAYVARAAFFNATARTADGFLGLIFRRPPFVRLPDEKQGVGAALASFRNDVDMLGTSLFGYAKNIVSEVIAVGRAGSLVDWEGDVENRVYVTMFTAESILNWRVERINGRNVPTLIVLHEPVEEWSDVWDGEDMFTVKTVQQVRVLRLVPGEDSGGSKRKPYFFQVEILREVEKKSQLGVPVLGSGPTGKTEWVLFETRVPLRRGKPLPLLPFVFHGPRHSRSAVNKLPLADIIAQNLDQCRVGPVHDDARDGSPHPPFGGCWAWGVRLVCMRFPGAGTPSGYDDFRKAGSLLCSFLPKSFGASFWPP